MDTKRIKELAEQLDKLDTERAYCCNFETMAAIQKRIDRVVSMMRNALDGKLKEIKITIHEYDDETCEIQYDGVTKDCDPAPNWMAAREHAEEMQRKFEWDGYFAHINGIIKE